MQTTDHKPPNAQSKTDITYVPLICYEPHRVTYPCYVQPKLNGIRALYQNGNFQSRDQLPFPPGLLNHLSSPLQSAFDPSVILDGELYVHGWPLQRINAAVTPALGNDAMPARRQRLIRECAAPASRLNELPPPNLYRGQFGSAVWTRHTTGCFANVARHLDTTGSDFDSVSAVSRFNSGLTRRVFSGYATRY